MNPSSHPVNRDEKCSFLFDGSASLRKKELNLWPLSKLKTKLYLGDMAWQGMHQLSANIGPKYYDWQNSEAKALAFTQNRLDQVEAHLRKYPYAFLTGLTGVGKTTFIEKELCKQPGLGHRLFIGEDKLQEWAQSPIPETGYLILFIDEANLSPSQWSVFEGLFQNPPTLLINDKLYPLTPNHKVIFAGNPISYGDERTLAPFFERHGGALLFEPLPSAVVYEQILKPVLTGHTEITIETIAKPILDAYQFISQCSKKEILISPRMLQMMALLVQSHLQKYTDEQDIQKITQQYVYLLGRNRVPKTMLAKFDKSFKPTLPSQQTDNIILASENTSFLVTPSRKPVFDLLNDLLDLREWRGSLNQEQAPDAQKYGGLGGMIIEGNPGIGKSELVISTLVNRGYKEARLDKPVGEGKHFYKIPASLPLKEKEALLLKAFDEGSIVIMDEINASPMMERLLNRLLMGQNPDGRTPNQPGFMIIGTQNPITMAGRRPTSSALENRMIPIYVPEYPHKELINLLAQRQIPKFLAEGMIKAFETKCAYAKRHHLTPAPTLRNLLSLADEIKMRVLKQLQDVQSQFKDLIKKLETFSSYCNSSQEPTVLGYGSFIKELKDAFSSAGENFFSSFHSQDQESLKQSFDEFSKRCNCLCQKAEKEFRHNTGLWSHIKLITKGFLGIIIALTFTLATLGIGTYHVVKNDNTRNRYINYFFKSESDELKEAKNQWTRLAVTTTLFGSLQSNDRGLINDIGKEPSAFASSIC